MMRTVLLASAVQLAITVAQGQITVDPMGTIAICGSPTIPISFTAVGTYNASNTFTMELSDAAGSFASPTVIGSSVGMVSGSITCTFPAGIVGTSGQAVRVTASDPPAVGAPYILPFTTVVPADAGVNTAITLCSNNGPVDLVTQLAGSPQLGGTWSGPMGSFNGIFNPSTDQAGLYSYFVAGAPPCVGATAIVSVVVAPAPNAGVGANITVCSTAAPFSMYAELGGSPDPGGMWTSPGSAPHLNQFTPGVDPSGCYVYTVLGVAPCMNEGSVLCIAVTPAPNAGTNTTISWCQGDGPFTMLAQLSGAPQAGGSWTDPFSNPHSGTFTPGVDPNGSYTYTIPAGGGCAAASATLDVTVNTTCMTTTPVGNLPTY